MKWIEIIEIRLFGNNDVLLNMNLQELLAELEGEKKPQKIMIYRQGELETDWSIHFHYRSNSDTIIRSEFGIRLASLLKEVGVVRHSIWKELRDSRSPSKKSSGSCAAG